MTTVAFDTLKFVERLEAGGFTREQAKAAAEAFAEAAGQELVNKSDLQAELHPVRVDLAVLKWMLGAVLAGVVSLVVKGFFG
ncbi:MAG: hypothetical protein RLZZ501_1139 [Pseudomonadota bacterium]|jgi:hypothetical protein